LALNKKLTPLITGRTIKSINHSDNILNISFTDSSIMKIKTAELEPMDNLPGHTLKAIRQKNDIMNLDFTDGSTVTLKLAEITSSVMLRDSTGTLEYVD
jgi:hypothetical protein